jgi:Fe-S-cluster containining protein
MTAFPPLDEVTVAAIRRMVEDLAGRDDHGDLARRLEALIDLLVMNGQLMPEHRAWLEGLHGERTQIKIQVFNDKRSLASPDVDCATLMPLCKGRCCAMAVSLSREDLREGRLQWDLSDPYTLARDPDTGYCQYMARDGGCQAYHDRPSTCRTYDCRRDPRVWLDYDRRIPAPLSPKLIPLGEWPEE